MWKCVLFGQLVVHGVCVYEWTCGLPSAYSLCIKRAQTQLSLSKQPVSANTTSGPTYHMAQVSNSFTKLAIKLSTSIFFPTVAFLVMGHVLLVILLCFLDPNGRRRKGIMIYQSLDRHSSFPYRFLY